jgi:prophage maintenance system killer protein
MMSASIPAAIAPILSPSRIAFALTDVFLRLNGFYLDVQAEAANKFIRGAMSRGEFRFRRIGDWITSNRKKLAE